jgi:1,2-diacylglycerol 3-beta-glucosyltransferase
MGRLVVVEAASTILVAGLSAMTATAVVVAVGTVVVAFCLYQLIVVIAALLYRAPGAGDDATPLQRRLVVVVPAHDEAMLIARCVQSLETQTYPSNLYDVVVVADNCTDDTAQIARAAGADVLVRTAPGARGKGHALRWAFERVLARSPAPDAVVVVDADSVADPELLENLVRPFERGAQAVQGESLLFDDGSPAATLRAAAFLLVNSARPAGRTVLGLPQHLAGNGMLFGAELLRAHPWDAFTSAEDAEYSITLRMAGVRPAFAGGAVVESPAAPNPEAAGRQQLRWEGGKLHLARANVVKLLSAAWRRRDPSLVVTALELALLPLGLLTAVAVIGAAVGAVLAAAGIIGAWAVVPWLVAVAAIPAYVLVGLRAARAPASAYRALARAPMFVLTKILRLSRLFTFGADTWVRTERATPKHVPVEPSAGDSRRDDGAP